MVPFIPFLVCSSIPNNSKFDVSTHVRQKLCITVVCMVATCQRGLDLQKGMNTPLYFYRIGSYQPQKKAGGWAKITPSKTPQRPAPS
jgi:hypothetical protein